jgi:hypothetical protein
MGIYRTYFDKNNTIVKDSFVNTGKNPVSELYYGQQVSRFLFYCSFNELAEKYINKTFDTGNVRHYLKIKNTSNFDVSQTLSENNNIVFTNKYRSTSFDLELRATKEFWDEGVGFDFAVNALQSSYPEDSTYNTNPANWYQSTTTQPFLNPGCTLSDTVIARQHFDNGDEDVIMDITDFVNDYLLNGITTGITSGATGTGITYSYSGFCLKYVDESYSFSDGNTRAMGLFTKYTQGFFEPFIESVYDDVIVDDRVEFYQNKMNRLYLYVNIDGQLKNLDRLPTCIVNGSAMTVYQQTTGVYYVNVFGDPNIYDTYVEYNDIWDIIIIHGVRRQPIILKFIPKPETDYFQIGSDVMEPVQYGISLSGINRDEKVPQGNVKKINVHLRKPYTVAQYDVKTNIYYRLYIKQGANQIEVLDWQSVNKVYNSNYFTIDTTWLVPQVYFVDIKVVRNGEVNIYNEELKFTVPSKISY